jgi:hypothetical protein
MHIKIGQEYFKAGHVNTPRVYYVFTIYDGLNDTFLTQIKEPKTDMKTAIKRLGGEQSDRNKALDMIAVENEEIKRWDPQAYMHSVPTLVLKGQADPVTQGGQAEHVFEHALTGSRVLFEFPGIGHSMSLPRLIEKDEKGNITNRNTRDYLLEEFISNDFKQLERVVLPKVRVAFDGPLKKIIEDGAEDARTLNVQAWYIPETGEKKSW